MLHYYENPAALEGMTILGLDAKFEDARDPKKGQNQAVAAVRPQGVAGKVVEVFMFEDATAEAIDAARGRLEAAGLRLLDFRPDLAAKRRVKTIANS
jgi:hypothetical protein